MTSHIYSQFCILHSDHQLDHKTLQHDQSLYHTSIRTASLSLPFSPPMDTSEMCVEILHAAERVVHLHTPQNPAEKWAFPLRVGCTGAGMLLHTLLDNIIFAAVWAHEGFVRFRVILSMGNFVVLPHPLVACKVPVTVRALHPPSLYTGRLVGVHHLLRSQYLSTFLTWKLFPMMYPHVLHEFMMIGEVSLAYRALGCISGHCR